MKRSLLGTLSIAICLHLCPAGLRADTAAFKHGYESFLQGDYGSAVAQLSSQAESKGPLRDYVLWALGKSRLETGDNEGGRKTLEALLRDEPGSLFADAAQVQIGRSLQAQGEAAQAKEHLQKILPGLGDASRGEALYYLGLSKLSLKETEAGLADLKEVYLKYPTSPVADQALSQLTQSSGGRTPTWGTAEYLPRAEAFFQAKSYTKALQVYEQIIAGGDPGLRDLARVKKGECLFNLKRYGDAVLFLEPGPSVPAEIARGALLDLGMSRLRSQDEAGAVATFERVQRLYPGTPEGEEALYRAGMIAHQAGRLSEAAEVFRRLAQAYPQGNFRDKALWAAAWNAYRRGNWDESLQWLSSMEQGAADAATRGKALYWQARVQERRGKKSEAQATFAKAAQASPYSYYGFMALKKTKGPEPFPETPAVPPEWKAPPPAPRGAGDGKAGTHGDLHLRKAEALVPIGLGRLAPAEVEAALKQNEGHPAGLAALLEAGKKSSAYFIPVQFGQKYWDRFKGLFADAASAESYRNRLLYPYAYRGLIEKAAARFSVPPHLVVALMRQESGFMPWISSSANAQGLMQLIPSTAAGRAKALGIPPGNLFDPEYNIPLGTAELKAMLDRFGGNWALAFAGYNAGPGRARQWNESFGSLPIDEFVEEIPFSETNLYVKLVMRNYWSYKTLYP